MGEDVLVQNLQGRNTGGHLIEAIFGERLQPNSVNATSKKKIGSDAGVGVSGRGYDRNNKTPRGLTHGVLR